MSIENKETLFKTLPLQTNKIFSNKLYFIPSPSMIQGLRNRGPSSFSNSGGIDKNPPKYDHEIVKFYHLF